MILHRLMCKTHAYLAKVNRSAKVLPKVYYFICDFDFYRFRLSIDINRRIKSMNQTDFRYRFLSINYVCNSNFQAFRQSERGRKIYEEKTTFSPRTLPTDPTDCRALSSERLSLLRRGLFVLWGGFCVVGRLGRKKKRARAFYFCRLLIF